MNILLHHAWKQKFTYLCFSHAGRSLMCTWYVQVQYISTVKKNFQTKYQNGPPARPYLWMGWELQQPRKLRTQYWLWNTHRLWAVGETSSCCFKQHSKSFPRRAVAASGIPYFTIPNILKKVVHTFPYMISPRFLLYSTDLTQIRSEPFLHVLRLHSKL